MPRRCQDGKSSAAVAEPVVLPRKAVAGPMVLPGLTRQKRKASAGIAGAGPMVLPGPKRKQLAAQKSKPKRRATAWNKGRKHSKTNKQHVFVPREQLQLFFAVALFFAGPTYCAVLWIALVTSRRIGETLLLKGTDVRLRGGEDHDAPHILFERGAALMMQVSDTAFTNRLLWSCTLAMCQLPGTTLVLSYALNMCFSVMTTSHRNRFLSLLLCICALSTAYYTLLCCDLFMGRVQRCDRSTVFQLCVNGVDLGKILWVGMDCKLSLSLCIQRCHFAPGQTSFISFAWSLVERLGVALVFASCAAAFAYACSWLPGC